MITEAFVKCASSIICRNTWSQRGHRPIKFFSTIGEHIKLSTVDDAERGALCKVAAELYSPLAPAMLAPMLDALLALPALRDLARYDGSYAAQAAGRT